MIPVLLAVAAMTGLGLLLLRPAGAGVGNAGVGDAERWLAAPLLGALPLAAVVQLVGAWHYSPTTMAGVLAVGLGVAALGLRQRPAWRLDLPRSPLLRALLGLAAVFAACAVLGAFAPPSDHDTLRYHLALPRRDLEAGRIAVRFGWSVYEFFPPLPGLLTRLVFATGGASAAQLLNVVWMLLAAGWVALLVVRLGGDATAAALAALLYLCQRVVVNLAGGVTEDFPLTAYVTASAAVGLGLLRHPAGRRWLLLGLLFAGALNSKYHALAAGGAVGLALLAEARLRRRPLLPLLGSAAVAGLLFIPFATRNALVTGNPLFPLLHPHFGADNIDIFRAFAEVSNDRRPLGGPLLTPLNIFLDQGVYDGLQFGFPILLIGLPFAFTENRRERLACLAMLLLYLAGWWWLMPHLLRFLQPVLGILAALAALGLASVMVAAAGRRWARAWLAGLVLLTAAVQFSLLGSTALYRLPLAFGWKDAAALEQEPFATFGLYGPCTWVESRLQPDERYLSLVNAPSFYCPQEADLEVIAPDEAAQYYRRNGLPDLAPAELARRIEEGNVRYLLAGRSVGPDDHQLVFSRKRVLPVLMPVLAELAPVMRWPSGRVYDAREVAALLRLRPQPHRQDDRP